MTAPGSQPAHVQDTTAPVAVSSGLYSHDLAPTQRSGRRWNAYNVFTLWANDVHSLGNYAFAIGLFALGLGAWQIMLAFLIGSAVIFGLLTLSGVMGHRTGLPFPVLSRIAFGIHGAQVAAVIRGGVAIAWFGIQTYLASAVLSTAIVALAPGLRAASEDSILGLSTVGWVTFSALWLVQVLIASYGMRVIRVFMAWAGPVVLVTMLAIAVWMFSKAGWSIAPSTNDALTGGAMWKQIFESAALWVVVYGTFVLNFCDFTRSATDRGAIVRGNLVGIPVNMLFFAGIVVVLSGSQFRINGEIITSPADIVGTIPNHALLVLASLALVVLTIAVNLLANFVAPIYTLTNLFPRVLNFRRAAWVSAVLGFVILPWNLYNNPIVIEYFLGGLGALLGPVFGVIVADYWLVRKARVNVPHLYTDDPRGDYHYKRGVNRRALLALLPSAALSVVLALVPGFGAVSSFSWFIGAALAAVLYLALADRGMPVRDVDGAEIAVASE
ncbi:NCS1 family nucleobase:cation symporter-1 [Bounagaea algeriensis]